MIPAMILAAGFGTRLRPLTDEAPKPLLWVGDRPQIGHILAHLDEHGVRRAVVNVFHLSAAFEDAGIDSGGIDVALSPEPTILGTAGGIAHAAPLLGEGPVLVWNGDILARVDVGAVGSSIAGAGDGLGACLVVTGDHLPGKGTLGLDRDGRVVRLRSFRGEGEVRGADYIGIAALSAAMRATLPREGCLVADVLMPWLANGGAIGTFGYDGPWHDIGSLAAYAAANRAWLDDRGLLAHRDPTARVSAHVTLHRSVVARGAAVEGQGVLDGCVVWPGAVARAPLSGCVVTPRGEVSLT